MNYFNITVPMSLFIISKLSQTFRLLSYILSNGHNGYLDGYLFKDLANKNFMISPRNC